MNTNIPVTVFLLAPYGNINGRVEKKKIMA